MSYSQIVNNGSFDGIQGVNDPNGWNSCLSSSSTDIQPGQWGINLQPYHGQTYLGMVCRGNFNVNKNTCEEIHQELNSTIIAQKCYIVSVQLAYSNMFSIDIFRNPVMIKFYLGSSSCAKEIMIAEFGPIDNTAWKNYSTTFSLKESMKYIWIEADYASFPEYFGNILLDSFSIEETNVSLVDLGNDTTLCQGETLFLQPGKVEFSFLWNNVDTSQSFTINQEGTYWVEIDNNCEVTYDTINVSFAAFPSVELGTDTTICQNETLILNLDSNTGSFLWQDNSSKNSLTVSQEGTYWVEFANNCGVTYDTIYVKIEDCDCQMYIPNTFTPNSDNINDRFMPLHNCNISQYNFLIFSRWGEKIFETSNINESWNGNYIGDYAQTGVYVYFIKYKIDNSEIRLKHGSITLVR